MRRIRFSTSVVVLIAAVGLFAGCGSSSSSSTPTGASSSTDTGAASSTGAGGATSSAGDKATFCHDNATIDKATASANTPDAALAAVKASQSTIADFGQNAPSDIKTQADVLVSGSKAAVNANSGAGFADPAFQAAGKAVNAYCGQDSNGDPVSNSSTTSTTP